MARFVLRSALVMLAFAPAAALAHTGIGDTGGFAHGFGHPLGGIDHLLAMVMVGLFAYQLGGRALWLVPLTFVSTMALGGVLGIGSVALPFVEVGIASSLVVFGAIVAFGVKAPVSVAMALVGLFAIFHGHAHGGEMPADVSGAAYATGFVLATALLHLFGIGVGTLIGMATRTYGKSVDRVAGGLASVAGVALLFGVN